MKHNRIIDNEIIRGVKRLAMEWNTDKSKAIYDHTSFWQEHFMISCADKFNSMVSEYIKLNNVLKFLELKSIYLLSYKFGIWSTGQWFCFYGIFFGQFN